VTETTYKFKESSHWQSGPSGWGCMPFFPNHGWISRTGEIWRLYFI